MQDGDIAAHIGREVPTPARDCANFPVWDSWSMNRSALNHGSSGYGGSEESIRPCLLSFN